MSEGKRERLLKAGFELLSEKTFSEISMEQVAEQSGLSKPMIYYYFKSKEGFYRALADKLLSVASSLMKDIFSPELSLRENFKRYVRKRLDYVGEAPGFSRAFMNMFHDPNIGLMIDDLLKEFERMRIELIDPLFDRAVQMGEIDPSCDRYLVLMMINSTLIGHTMKVIADLPCQFMTDPMGMVDMIFDGIDAGSPKGGGTQ